jgi:tRNA pseudouridine38-40 synthase
LTTQPEGPFGCCVHEARWDRWEAGYVLVLRSNRFLYQMVRIVVGTCVEIGRGRRGSAALAEILAGGDRRAAGPLAPAHGLYLDGVGYDPPWPEDAPLLPPLPPLADR